MYYQNFIEQRLKIIKLLILIRYLYELQKARRLLALGFEAFNDLYDQGKRLTSLQEQAKLSNISGKPSRMVLTRIMLYGSLSFLALFFYID